jgi:hypothetical protein
MYDDRGCDLVSTDIELLKKCYAQMSGLILKDNRSEIVERLNIKPVPLRSEP